MVEWRLKSRRKASGGIRKSRNRSDKKKAWIGRNPAMTRISSENKREKIKVRGNKAKIKLRHAKEAIVSEKGKTFKAIVVNVLKNDSNRQFARRQIITKGAIIEIELKGQKRQAIVTSRPGQKGVLQAKLLEKPIKIEKEKKAEKKPEKKTPKPDSLQETALEATIEAKNQKKQ